MTLTLPDGAGQESLHSGTTTVLDKRRKSHI